MIDVPEPVRGPEDVTGREIKAAAISARDMKHYNADSGSDEFNPFAVMNCRTHARVGAKSERLKAGQRVVSDNSDTFAAFALPVPKAIFVLCRKESGSG